MNKTVKCERACAILWCIEAKLNKITQNKKKKNLVNRFDIGIV